MTDIKLLSDDELAEELMCRYDDMVIAGRRILDKGITKTQRVSWYNGDREALVGLANTVSHKILKGLTDDDTDD